MTAGQRLVLDVFDHVSRQEALDRYVAERWPHDIYQQTVAVMGHDPLGENLPPSEPEPEPEHGAANLMPRDSHHAEAQETTVSDRH